MHPLNAYGFDEGRDALFGEQHHCKGSDCCDLLQSLLYSALERKKVQINQVDFFMTMFSSMLTGFVF